MPRFAANLTMMFNEWSFWIVSMQQPTPALSPSSSSSPMITLRMRLRDVCREMA